MAAAVDAEAVAADEVAAEAPEWAAEVAAPG
jgi:hypothetical protein